jgi:hypothetical protein
VGQDPIQTTPENGYEDTEHDDLKFSHREVKENSLRSSQQRVSAKYLTENLTRNPNDISRMISTPRTGIDQDESVEYFLKSSHPDPAHPPPQKTDPELSFEKADSKISANNPTK